MPPGTGKAEAAPAARGQCPPCGVLWTMSKQSGGGHLPGHARAVRRAAGDSTGSTPPEVRMSSLRPLLKRNRAFAATGAHAGLAIMPRQQVFLVTCLDPRVDPAAFLGVELGDAPVIRNAGGRVTEAVIDDIAFISYLARTMIPDGPLFEVAIVHHTGCGSGFVADAGFRSAFAAGTGLDEAALAAEAVIDPVATVRADV